MSAQPFDMAEWDALCTPEEPQQGPTEVKFMLSTSDFHSSTPISPISIGPSSNVGHPSPLPASSTLLPETVLGLAKKRSGTDVQRIQFTKELCGEAGKESIQ